MNRTERRRRAALSRGQKGRAHHLAAALENRPATPSPFGEARKAWLRRERANPTAASLDVRCRRACASLLRWAWPVLMGTGADRSCCILATKLAIEVLGRLGIRAAPMPLKMLILNPEASRAYREALADADHVGASDPLLWASQQPAAWTLGLGYGPPRPGRYPRQLAVLVEDRIVLDLAPGVADRPEKGIVIEPYAVALPDARVSPKDGAEEFACRLGEVTIKASSDPDDGRFLTPSDWRCVPGCLDMVFDLVREDLEFGDRFDALLARHDRELGDAVDREHPAYRELLGLGVRCLALVVEAIAERPRRVLEALALDLATVAPPPIDAEDREHQDAIRRAYLDWGMGIAPSLMAVQACLEAGTPSRTTLVGGRPPRIPTEATGRGREGEIIDLDGITPTKIVRSIQSMQEAVKHAIMSAIDEALERGEQHVHVKVVTDQQAWLDERFDRMAPFEVIEQAHARAVAEGVVDPIVVVREDGEGARRIGYATRASLLEAIRPKNPRLAESLRTAARPPAQWLGIFADPGGESVHGGILPAVGP